MNRIALVIAVLTFALTACGQKTEAPAVVAPVAPVAAPEAASAPAASSAPAAADPAKN